MPHDPARTRRIAFRLYLLASLSVVLFTMFYVGWVFHSRRELDRAIEQKAMEQKRADDQQTVERLGGNRFEILNFYATSRTVRHGDSLELCYGVSNAKSVRLEPHSGEVWPSYSRCISVSPRRSTTYTLTAEDAAGHTKTATLTVEVR